MLGFGFEILGETGEGGGGEEEVWGYAQTNVFAMHILTWQQLVCDSVGMGVLNSESKRREWDVLRFVAIKVSG